MSGAVNNIMEWMNEIVTGKTEPGTIIDALQGMNRGEIWTRRKFITNATELQFWLDFDAHMPKGLQLGESGPGRRVILAGKIGNAMESMVYVPTWDDFDADDWICRSRPG